MKDYIMKYWLLLGLVMALAASCTESSEGFLDPTDTGTLNEAIVFADSAYVHQFQAKLYRDLSNTYYLDNGLFGGGYWSFSDASDDSRLIWGGATAQASPAINRAEFSGGADFSRFKNHWRVCYENIRRAAIFIKNIDVAPLSHDRKTQMVAEVRFLRAWYYYHLFRLYGGVPLLGDKVYSLADPVDVGRSDFDRTLQYISDELDVVAGILPIEQLPENYGRPTQGAALALKSRLYLFAASPLFNGENPAEGKVRRLTGYDSYDANRWKKAADAAKVVMELNRYALVVDNATAPGYGFYQTTIQRKNQEIIFSIMKANDRYFEGMLLPRSRGGQAYSSPWQGLVDAFPMANGKMIDEPGSGYDAANPYKNRDPRFGYTILHDGSMWIPKSGSAVKERVNFYNGAATDGIQNASGATKTGYLFRKFCNENISGSGSNNSGLVVIRHAEILLNYAEALNEYLSTPSSEVYAAVEAVRMRAGLTPHQLSGGLTKEQMRAIIRNERRVEFAAEEAHRYFDVKRWKIAEQVCKGDFFGIRWSNPSKQPQTYEIFRVESHNFIAPKMYYWPIPLSEINKVGDQLLPQNPGWD